MKIVIITKDQPEYVPIFEEFLRGYEHVYVIDRPTKEYPSNIPAIVNRAGDGFLAGRMRDLGATVFAGEDILFLDGGKVPSVTSSRSRTRRSTAYCSESTTTRGSTLTVPRTVSPFPRSSTRATAATRAESSTDHPL